MRPLPVAHVCLRELLSPLLPRHEQDADDDEQEPGRQLTEVDERPTAQLVRVRPAVIERDDILGEPDEAGNQKEGDDDGHRETAVVEPVRDDGPAEDEKTRPINTQRKSNQM